MTPSSNEAISGDPVAANNGNLSYLLDAVANRTSLTSTLAALSNQSFSFDANDRIASDTSDANGNTLASGGKSYSYDFLDRLVTATGGITLVYDGDGNRVGRNTTRYLIDDQTPVGYAQVAEEVVGGVVMRRYAYGLQRISQTAGPTTSYYLYDGGGTVRALADGAGTVTDTFTYDAFGNLVARTGSTANDMLYRGEQFDAGLGLYYLRARWYNPEVGRFVSVDSFEGLPANADTLHGYNYAAVDPVQFSDPTGHLKGPTYGPPIALGAQLAARRQIFRYVAGAATTVATIVVAKLAWDALCSISKSGSALDNAIVMDDMAQGGPERASAYLDPCSLSRDDKKNDCKCKPCEPPAGTRAYRVDDKPDQKPHFDKPTQTWLRGPHWHLYQMNQNPKNCQCFWLDLDQAGPYPPSPAGAVPIGAPGGGGCCNN